MTVQPDLNESNSILQKTLDTLGWLPINRKAPELLPCSYNPNHWIPKDGLTKHNHYCALRQQGYYKAEIEAMIPNPESVSTGLTKQSCIDWTTDPQWNTNLKAFEVNKRNRMRLMQANSTESSESTSSKLEALALMRDLKRRRQSYRGIHTAKKSYTEVLRELITQQTDLLLQSCQSESRHEGHRPRQNVNPKPDDQSGQSDHQSSRRTHQTNPDESQPSHTTGCRKSRHRDRHSSSGSESKHSKKPKKHKHHHKHKHHKQ